jgi:hypothetical protein
VSTAHSSPVSSGVFREGRLLLLPKSGMRLGEALRIAIPIADALAAAHAKRRALA